MCHLSYSGISILHQAWASRLGGGASQQSRVVAWREGAGLAGVVIASALPVMAGWLSTTAFLGLMLFLGLVVWSRVLLQTQILKDSHTELTDKDNYLPLKQISFRKLLWVFLLNGIASAVPAGLVMFLLKIKFRHRLPCRLYF